MWPWSKMLFGSSSPADGAIKCPSCGRADTLRGFATWEKDGQRGLRGKLPTGHIVVACPDCRKEFKWDSLSGKASVLTSGDVTN